MINIEVKHNIKKVIGELRNESKLVKKAEQQTNRRIAKQAATHGKKVIRETYNIKASELNKDIKVRGGSGSKIEAFIYACKRGIGLVKYGARQVKKGVSVAVKKGKRKLLPGFFKATMKSGHEGVFVRQGKPRLPIKEKYGPASSELLGSRKVLASISKYINTNYGRVFRQRWNYLRSKKK